MKLQKTKDFHIDGDAGRKLLLRRYKAGFAPREKVLICAEASCFVPVFQTESVRRDCIPNVQPNNRDGTTDEHGFSGSYSVSVTPAASSRLGRIFCIVTG